MNIIFATSASRCRIFTGENSVLRKRRDTNVQTFQRCFCGRKFRSRYDGRRHDRKNYATSRLVDTHERVERGYRFNSTRARAVGGRDPFRASRNSSCSWRYRTTNEPRAVIFSRWNIDYSIMGITAHAHARVWYFAHRKVGIRGRIQVVGFLPGTRAFGRSHRDGARVSECFAWKVYV